MHAIVLLLVMFFLGDSSQAAEPAQPKKTPKFTAVVLDFGPPEIYGGEPTVWLSPAGASYSAIVESGKKWHETRYTLHVTAEDSEEIEIKALALLKDGKRNFRDPVFGEFVTGIFLTKPNGKTVCFEKPESEPWAAFDSLKNRLLQLHKKAVADKAVLEKVKWESDYESVWSPSGFLTFKQRQKLRPTVVHIPSDK